MAKRAKQLVEPVDLPKIHHKDLLKVSYEDLIAAERKHIALGVKDTELPKPQCIHCPLLHRPMVQGSGTPPNKGVCRGVVCGEAPGRNEAKQGVPFIGDSGKLLTAILEGATDLTRDDLYFTNTALCHPPANKIPWRAAQCCRPRLLAELAPYQAEGIPILAAGAVAGKALTGILQGSLRGQWHDGVICTWHPAYILRTGGHFSELVHDVQKLANGGPLDLPYPHYHVVEDIDDLNYWVNAMLKQGREGLTICFDLETDQLVYWEHRILCMAFAYDVNRAWVIPAEMVYLPETAEALNRLFAPDNGITFVGHNAKFDIRYLRHQLGVQARADDDSLVAHYLIDETMYHGLKPLLTNYLDIGDYEGELVKKYLKSKNDMYSSVPADQLMEYNVLDVCYNLRLWFILKEQLEADDMFEMPYRYPLMAALPHMVDMELYGLYCDVDELHRLSEEMGDGAVKLQEELEEMCGYEFNPNSWMQVQKIMYDHFALPTVRVRNAKPKTTCAEARLLIRQKLAGWGRQDSVAYKWLEGFDQLKSLLKLKSSYIDNLFYRKRTNASMIDPEGKIHPDCLLYGTETGRVSFRDPAIQTIPRPGTGSALGDTWGQYIRAAYCKAPEGWSIMEVDISQAEMRVAAALSGEPFLLQVYQEGRDLHSEVAVAMYGEEYTKDERNNCKKFNFAYLYGGTEHSFAMETGMSMTLARQFVRRYKKLMTTLEEWKQGQLKTLRTRGYVETVTKRRRRYPLITNDNLDDARKAAGNMPVQGAASDVTLMTFISVCDWLKAEGIDYAKMVATIHDSVLLEVRNDKVEEVGRKVQSIMKATGEKWFPQVPWKVDIDLGPDWGHLEAYDDKH